MAKIKKGASKAPNKTAKEATSPSLQERIDELEDELVLAKSQVQKSLDDQKELNDRDDKEIEELMGQIDKLSSENSLLRTQAGNLGPYKDLQESSAPTIVIPYKSSSAKGNELQYAIRAWEKNLPDCKIVIIGDREDWFGDDLVVVEHDQVGDNPQIDVAHRMMAAIASDEVPEKFIWSNDDIYPLGPLTMADLEFHKAMGKLSIRGSKGGVYRANSERTVLALQIAGIKKPLDYACHTPTVFEKELLADTIVKFKAEEEGFLISTLYYNFNFPDTRPVITSNAATGSIVMSVYRANPDKRVVARGLEERKFLNNNDAGWIFTESKLKELFPEPSRFES